MKLNVKPIFNLNSFVTVGILLSIEVLKQLTS